MTEFHSNWPLPADYAPPALGNGTLALQIDPRCSMEQKQYCYAISFPTIVRTGYRYDNHAKNMVSFGFFETFSADWGIPVSVRQNLDQRHGILSGECRYANGLTVEYTVFCRLNSDFLAFRLHFRGGSGEERPFFRYTLDSRRMELSVREPYRIRYMLDGLGAEPVGTIGLFSEKEAEFRARGRCFSLNSPEREAVFYLAFGERAIAAASAKNFEEHLSEQAAEWSDYFAKGYLVTPDETCNRACDTALYYLRTVTTPYSIPTGLIPSHWQCRYFCFDEFFDLTALLRAGHPEEAKHVPEFRLSILPVAQRRYYNYNIEDGPAHYPWESGEDGLEATTDGFWQDHCFEHAHVVLGCYEYWKYSGDDSAVERYYPVMRACVRYLELQRIYRDPVKGAHIGIVTDLERLGPSKFNPYMTACSAIAALRAAAEAAEFLGRDSSDAANWRKLAEELFRNLPDDGTRYLAYPGAKDTAIGMFSGAHPYGVIPLNDPKQLAAVEDFIAREDEFGCMLKTMGREICTWYSAWKTLFFARRGDRAKASEFLEYTVNTTGHFGESFESNRRIGGRPWFSTGSAAVLQAATECLFQSDGNTLKLAPAVSESWRDYEFLLAAPGDLKVHCKARNGRITELDFLCGAHHKKQNCRIVYPDGSVCERMI